MDAIPGENNRLIDQLPTVDPSPVLQAKRTLALLTSYRPTQIGQRIWNLAWQKIRRGVRVTPPVPSFKLNPTTESRLIDLFDGRRTQWARQWNREKQTQFERGIICLLNESRSIGGSLSWESDAVTHASHLWRFHLHYHEYLLRSLAWGQSLPNTQLESTQTWVRAALESWFDFHDLDHRSAHGDAWHPYVISRRLPIWCQLVAQSWLPDELKSRLLREIVRNARCLEVNLERDLCGNHLLENLRGLGYAASLVTGKWSDAVQHQIGFELEKQLAHQVLPSGEHYERSPMYHCQVTGILLELATLYRGQNSRLENLCTQTSRKMLPYIKRILHPDGEIPLFSDSVFEEAPDLATLQAWQPDEKNDSPTPPFQDDYWIVGENSNRLIVDCGPVAARDLPAHGHCDLGNFEWSHGGVRWITDSGVIDYSGSNEHFFCRSSLAHNVVTLEHRNLCDIWGKFRMGRRAHPLNLQRGKSACGNFEWLQFEHDGYWKTDQVKMNRLMVYHSTGCFWVADYSDCVNRNDLPTRVGYFHFAPQCNIRILPDSSVEIQIESEIVTCTSTHVEQTSRVEGLYCSEFGKMEKRTVIEYEQHGVSRPIIWSFVPGDVGFNVETESSLESGTQRFQVGLQVLDLSWP